MARENIDVTVDLTDQLSRPAKRAEAAIDDLGDEVDDLNRSLATNSAASRKAQREMDALARASGRAERAEKRRNDQTKTSTKDTDRLSMLVRVLGGEVGKTTKRFLSFRKALMLLGIQAVVLAVSLLVTALGALAAGAFAAVAALSPLVGLFAGALPSLITAAAQGFAAVKVGLSGIGDAVKAIGEGDPAKIAEAMRKLTPEGRELATVLGDLVQGPLRDIKRATQSAIAPGFTRALQNLRPLLPVIERGLAATADTMGDLAARAGRATNTPLFRAQFARIMAANNAALRQGGLAAGSLGMAALGVADAFRPVQREMSRAVRAAADYINASVQAGLESGRLTAFFQRAWDLAKGFGRGLRDLSVALYNTGVQSAVLGDAMGKGLGESLAAWRAWTESIEGQNAIREWFEEAGPVLSATLDLLGMMVRAFGDMSNSVALTSLLRQLESDLFPAIGDLADAISNDLGPAIIDIATGFVEFVRFLSASPLADILASVATVVLALAQGLNALPGPIKFAAAALISFVFASNLLAASLGRLAASRLYTSLSALFTSIRTGAQAGTIGMSGLSRATGAMQGAALGARYGMAGLAGTLAGGAFTAALVGATFLIGKVIAKQQEAKRSAQEYADALDDQTGALTRQNYENVKRSLLESGMADNAAKLGVSLGDVTEAALGNEAALLRVQEALNGIDTQALSGEGDFKSKWIFSETAEYDSALNDLRNYLRDQQAIIDQGKKNFQYEQEIDRQRRLTALRDEAALVLSRMSDKQRAAAGSTEVLTGAQRSQYAAQAAARNAAQDTTGKLDDQAEATRGVITVTRELNGLLDNRATFVGFKQQLLTTTEALKGVKGALNEQRTGLNLNTQAGIDTWNTFRDLATAAAGIKNEAQRTEALKVAENRIKAWGEAAGLTEDAAARLAGEFITVRRKAEEIPKQVKTEVTAETEVATARLQRFRDTAAGIAQQIANLFTFNVPAPPAPLPSGSLLTDPRARRDGGPVWTGETFTVGEVGPELFVGAATGAVSVIGAGGQEQRRFAEPGWVLPNETYQAAAGKPVTVATPVAAPQVAPAPIGAPSGRERAPEVPLPSITIQMSGDGSALTEADIERAAVRAYRRMQREQKERR